MHCHRPPRLVAANDEGQRSQSDFSHLEMQICWKYRQRCTGRLEGALLQNMQTRPEIGRDPGQSNYSTGGWALNQDSPTESLGPNWKSESTESQNHSVKRPVQMHSSHAMRATARLD